MNSLVKLGTAFFASDLDTRADILVRCLNRRTGNPEAQQLLCMISIVWSEEAYSLQSGPNSERPDKGVLRALGYHVGWNQGRPEHERRLILDYLIDAQVLPPIKDRSYMAEWGTACSRVRIDKLSRALRNFIAEYEGLPLHRKAVREWKLDLEYIRTRWLK